MAGAGQSQGDITGNHGSGRHRRRAHRQPYGWLGAGALTVGLGAALTAGSGVACADSTDAGGSAAGNHSSAGSATTTLSHRKHVGVGSSSAGGASHLTGRAGTHPHTVTGEVSAAPGAAVSVAATGTTTPAGHPNAPTAAGDVTAAAPHALAASMPVAAASAVTLVAAAPATATATASVAASTSTSTTVAPQQTLQQLVQQIQFALQAAILQVQQQLAAAVAAVTRNIQIAVHPAPFAGTATEGPPDPTTGAVTGALGFTAPGNLPLTYTVNTGPAQGNLTLTAAGGYTYTPTAAARLAAALITTPITDSFTVTAHDGTTSTTTKTITVTISAAAAKPTAGTPNQGGPDGNGRVTGNLGITSPAGLTLTYTVGSTNTAEGGFVSIDAAGNYSYTPADTTRYNAGLGLIPNTDTFAVTATNLAGSLTETVTVPISPLYDRLPGFGEVVDIQVVDQSTGQESGYVSAATSSALFQLRYLSTSGTTEFGGTYSVNSAGVLTFTPTVAERVQAGAGPLDDQAFVGVSDGFQSGNVAVSIPVFGVNDTPTGPVISGTVTVDRTHATVTGTLTSTDQYQLPLTYTVTSQPGLGTVTLNPDGDFTYTGGGNDTFTVTATNGYFTSDPSTITVPRTF